MPGKLLQFDFSQIALDGGYRLREVIANEGVAIVTNVLTPSDIESAKSGMVDWIKERVPNFSIDDPSTFAAAARSTFIHRIVKHYGVGQAQFMVDLRSNPRVLQMFSAIHNIPVDQLRCGFDGCCFMPPPEHLSSRHRAFDDNSKGWLHRDQSLVDARSEQLVADQSDTIQGLVNLIDATRDDGTFTCIPGTQIFTEQLRERWEARGITKAKMRAQWLKMSDEDLNWITDTMGYHVYRVPLPAGSMVFWDSRTIHSNCYPKRSRSVPRWRMCAYICMFPETRNKEPARRVKLFLERATTDHRGFKNNGDKPRFCHDEVVMTSPPKMTPEAWQLIHGSPVPVEGAIQGVHYI